MNSLFEPFTALASWLIYQVLGLDPADRLASALHFFIEDTTKIFVLLIVMIYAISWLRASLDIERVRDYLAGRHRGVGYMLGAGFGAITPFCSCSSIPVFLGFSSAGIPVGITMAFLLTSPLINEVAILLLLSLLGWKFTIAYVGIGLAVGMAGGIFLDRIHAERWLQSFAADALAAAQQQKHEPAQTNAAPALSWRERHAFAGEELKEIFGRVWKWVILGVGLGAALHGFVPDGWLEAHLGNGQWWSVPAAVLLGIPLYSNATGVIPVMESLILKGLPIGTTLAFCMSTVAASFPEFILLKQVMQWRLLAIIFVMLLVAFTLVGWIFNLLSPFI
ncbi:Putative two-component membrane permease complex subunit SMU_747c [BD1-7 clade bacterium]|uniref:Two-component membrane permease complex subunit SMU_747c n=1 Tax=BD1-7 clade bacterium TaxID=2029982 RepID=A0A5S9Q7F3_9GAMM|nr:Putative two-component membrane permease complex subunit SMU_747c [BD1-7 clade bacterium]CAA0113255.1 Putative two-component membrane permease complex subunit SMU_747c [BD1-7 clade bacterium]